MTKPIPPRPVCGKVPTLIMYGGEFPFASDLCRCLADANLIGNSDRTFPVCWENGVNILLGRAISSRGIHTIAQLDAALSNSRTAIRKSNVAKMLNHADAALAAKEGKE